MYETTNKATQYNTTHETTLFSKKNELPQMGCVGINIYNTHVYTHLQNTVCYVSNDTDGKRFTQKSTDVYTTEEDHSLLWGQEVHQRSTDSQSHHQ